MISPVDQYYVAPYVVHLKIFESKCYATEINTAKGETIALRQLKVSLLVTKINKSKVGQCMYKNPLYLRMLILKMISIAIYFERLTIAFLAQ